MVVEDRRKPGAEEFAKMEFELFKHLTTLSAAVTVAVLAVYREIVVDQLLLVLTLLAFAGAAVLALVGMLEVTGRVQRWSQYGGEYQSFGPLLYVTGGCFVGGIMNLAFSSLLRHLPVWVQGAATGFILLLFAGLLWRWSRHLRRNEERLQKMRRERDESRDDIEKEIIKLKHMARENAQKPPKETRRTKGEEKPGKRSWWRRWFRA